MERKKKKGKERGSNGINDRKGSREEGGERKEAVRGGQLNSVNFSFSSQFNFPH